MYNLHISKDRLLTTGLLLLQDHLFQAFAKEGAKVIATDIQVDKLKELEAFGE